jgi:hypothetical protein
MPGMKDMKTKYLNSLSHGTRAVFPYTLQKICKFPAVPTDSCEQGKAGHTNACIKRAHAGPIAHHAPRLASLPTLFSLPRGNLASEDFFFPFSLFFLLFLNKKKHFIDAFSTRSPGSLSSGQ